MTMKDMQKQVDDWVQQFKITYWQPMEQLARLTEETGELAREFNHRYGPKKKKSTEDLKDIEDELGDLIFTIICIANAHKINLDSAFVRVMDKYYGRDNNRYEKK